MPNTLTLKNIIALPKLYPSRYHLQTKTITTADGTSLPISVIGQGPPVMLLHAYGMDAREFLPFIWPLLGKHTFYLPHLRGFGLAQPIRLTQFDFLRQYAEDIHAVIETVCAEYEAASMPIAGISMGAQVMWAYFERFGTYKVSQFLNIDQNPAIRNQPDWQGGLFGSRQQEVFDIFHDVIDMTSPYADIDNFTHLPFAIKRRATDVERLFSLLSVNRTRSKAFIQLMTYKNDPKLALYNHSIWHHKMQCLQAYLTLPYDFREAIDKVTIPVVNLIGGRSKLYDPKWQQKVTQMLPDATEIILPNSGHAVPIDASFEFYHILKRFLQNK